MCRTVLDLLLGTQRATDPSTGRIVWIVLSWLRKRIVLCYEIEGERYMGTSQLHRSEYSPSSLESSWYRESSGRRTMNRHTWLKCKPQVYQSPYAHQEIHIYASILANLFTNIYSLYKLVLFWSNLRSLLMSTMYLRYLPQFDGTHTQSGRFQPGMLSP